MSMIINLVDKHCNHITVTDDDGVEYEYSVGLHRGVVTAEDCLYDIKQQMYRNAKVIL